jgi:protein phosphatase
VSVAEAIRIECSAVSDPGQVRPTNEDQFLIGDLRKSLMIYQTSLSRQDHSRLIGDPQGRLLLVADGMGGMGGGRTASSVVVDTVVEYVVNVMPWFFRLDQAHEEDLRGELAAVVKRCEASLRQAAERGEGSPRMGTTLTLAYLLWPRAYVVHAGDSRCYLFRDGSLRQVTRDQTLAQRLAENRVLTPEQAEESSWRNVLWSAIGGAAEELRPEVYTLELEVGDALLLCTDGLTKHVPDREIASVLAARVSADDACRKLVGLANRAGGTDNVTVVLAACASVDAQEAAA